MKLSSFTFAEPVSALYKTGLFLMLVGKVSLSNNPLSNTLHQNLYEFLWAQQAHSDGTESKAQLPL